MSIDELRNLIETAQWFANLGNEAAFPDGCVQIKSLEAWAGNQNLEENHIADGMDWLPTARDQKDPIHGRDLERLAETQGISQECTRCSVDLYRRTLQNLRSFAGNSILRAGPHDFMEAARGAALFAVKRAGREVLVGKPGFWCRLIQIYHAGHWPCGILPDNTIVVL